MVALRRRWSSSRLDESAPRRRSAFYVGLGEPASEKSALSKAL